MVDQSLFDSSKEWQEQLILAENIPSQSAAITWSSYLRHLHLLPLNLAVYIYYKEHNAFTCSVQYGSFVVLLSVVVLRQLIIAALTGIKPLLARRSDPCVTLSSVHGGW